jgi:hypothetical protein
MPEATPEMLTDILGRVLEESAYILAEPDQEPPSWDGSILRACIAFESTRGGTLRLLTNAQAASEIAANMLGIDQGDEEARSSGRAAVSELLNVVGGAFLTRYFGTAVPSQLGLPDTEILPAPPEGVHRTCAAAVRLESGAPLVLELDLEER